VGVCFIFSPTDFVISLPRMGIYIFGPDGSWITFVILPATGRQYMISNYQAPHTRPSETRPGYTGVSTVAEEIRRDKDIMCFEMRQPPCLGQLPNRFTENI
jgi:hypothetical protein